MRIELNRDICIGSATCAGFAPSAFQMGGDGLAVLKVEDADGVDAAALEQAVANCPTGSITLVDSE